MRVALSAVRLAWPMAASLGGRGLGASAISGLEVENLVDHTLPPSARRHRSPRASEAGGRCPASVAACSSPSAHAWITAIFSLILP